MPCVRPSVVVFVRVSGRFRPRPSQVKAFLEEADDGGKYVERATQFGPTNRRQRWLAYEFVGQHNTAVKLSGLEGPGHARMMEVTTAAAAADKTASGVWGGMHVHGAARACGAGVSGR